MFMLNKLKGILKKKIFWLFVFVFFGVTVVYAQFLFPQKYQNANDDIASPVAEKVIPPNQKVATTLDTVAYDKKMELLANNLPDPLPTTKIVTDSKTGVKTTVTIPAKKAPVHIWPVKTVYPNTGALLPFNRIVAFYGNFYSKRMGILGEFSQDEVLAKLTAEVKKWNDADPTTPVIPAIHYVATTAQSYAGTDKKYISRMPDKEIDKAIEMAKKINGIVFLDVQVSLSNVQTEIPRLEKYLKMPQVHLGIDPEFSMKNGKIPGKYIGTMDATDINWVEDYLAKVVKDNNLTPKILIVHRFTGPMVTNYRNIKIVPEVQFVMDMDGWGPKDHKEKTYGDVIHPQPVQFTGFKIFYKNDTKNKNTVVMTPSQVLKLRPIPSYIQYQ